MRFTVEGLSEFPGNDGENGSGSKRSDGDEEELSPQEQLYNSLIERAALVMLEVDYLRMETLLKVGGNLGRILIELTAGLPYESYPHEEFELLNNDRLLEIRAEGIKFVITIDSKNNIVYLFETKFVDLEENGIFNRDELISKILTIDVRHIPNKVLQSSIDLSNYLLEKLVAKLEGMQRSLSANVKSKTRRSAAQKQPRKRYTMQEVWGPYINSSKIASKFPSKQ